MHGDSSSGSDYDVETYIRPKRIRRIINDDSADLLGNFDDEKRQCIFDGTYEEKEVLSGSSGTEETSVEENKTDRKAVLSGSSGAEESSDEENKTNRKAGGLKCNEESSSTDETDQEKEHSEESDQIDGNLTNGQLAGLLRGASKANRFVLYVTNQNFETTKEDLAAHFSSAGSVKSIRIPKKRRGGFAFVEMTDIEGFRNAFRLHNTELQGRQIKVQISEAGKKKSANKKNIIKQKNRKLAEMRNEQKTFTKSGKFYDKDLKQEKAREMLARKRWRKQLPAK